MALAGAGGGGFLYVLMKSASFRDNIKNIIDESDLNMQIYDACISEEGIEFNFS